MAVMKYDREVVFVAGGGRFEFRHVKKIFFFFISKLKDRGYWLLVSQ